MAQADHQFPSVSSQTKGLKVNADGSADVYFGPKAPAGEKNSWAHTAPGRTWNILLRLYGGEKPFFDQSWRAGEIGPAPLGRLEAQAHALASVRREAEPSFAIIQTQFIENGVERRQLAAERARHHHETGTRALVQRGDLK